MRAKPSHYIMGILLFTLIMVGSITLLGLFANDKPELIDNDKYQEFNESFIVLDDVTTEIEKIEESITQEKQDKSIFGILDTLYNTGWSTLQLLFSSFSFMNTVFNSLSTIFGIPGWIITIIISMISIMISFGIYSAIFQKDL